MIITISGTAGSGKSTVGKLLAKKLNFKHYSMGDLQRKYAQERHLTIEKLGELEAKDPSIDREVDISQTKLAEKEDNFVIDSWLGFHFIKKAFKIFLDVDETIGAKRIFDDTKSGRRGSDEKKAETLEEANAIRKQRMQTNQERWLRYYHVDFLNLKNYDLLIDTSENNPETIVNEILAVLNKKNEE